MKKLLTSLALVVALPIGIASADAPKADGKTDAKSEPAKADVDKWVAFFDKTVDIVVVDKADCTKMAGDLSKHIDANQDLLKKASEAKAKGQTLPKDVQDHMTAGAQKLFTALKEKCMNDKGVQDAIKKFQVK